MAHFLCDAAYAFGFNNSNGESAESCDVFRTVASAYAASIFIIVPIKDVVAAVFDTPMAAVGGENALWVGLLRGSAGDAIGEFTGAFAGFFVCAVAFNDKSLSNVGEVEVAVELVCAPDLADFDPPVIRGCAIDVIGFPTVFEVQLDVLKERGLVALDGEVIMGLAFFDEISGELALG